MWRICGLRTVVTDRLITLDMDQLVLVPDSRFPPSICFLRLLPSACCLVPLPINRLMRSGGMKVEA